jgi:alpha-mannosidase
VDREALVFNEAPMAVSFFPSGLKKKAGLLLKLSDDVVQVTAIKKSKQGDDLVVRLFEPTGRDRSTRLLIPSLKLDKEILMKGFEIKTLLVNRENGHVSESNLLEEAY